MKGGNAAVELAERRVEQERDAGIARIQAAARQYVAEEANGQETVKFCECGERIPEERRKAMPRADRCVDCETFIERQSRRRA